MTGPTQDGTLARSTLAGWGRVAVASIGRAPAGEADLEYVRLAQRGDAAAFDRLAAARIDREFRLASAILRSDADARDAVQEALIAAWRQLPRLRDPASFDAWLDRIVVNACRMALRHRRVVRVREIAVAEPGTQPAPDDDVGDVELVRRAMDRLDGDQRVILVLHHVEGRPVTEVAGILRIPVGTAKWRLHAARAALERAYEEEAR